MKSFADFLRHSSFRRQLSITVTLGVLAIALFSSLGTSWQGSSQIQKTLREQGERVAENLARQSKLALLYDSGENATDVLNVTLAFPDVLQVEIRHLNGRALVVRNKMGQPAAYEHAPLPAEQRPAWLEGETDDQWRFVAPVYAKRDSQSPFDLEHRGDELLGYVRVVQSKATMQRMRADIFLVNLGLSFSCAFLFLAAIWALTGRLTRPLIQLSQAMARAEHGETGVRAQISGSRDIADMAHAFNSMMVVLEEREQELRQARDEAVTLARLKAEFAATVTHEIRTPLTGVVGTLDILLATALPVKQRQFVQLAWDSTQYLLDLINNILDFSKLEAGKLELEKVEFGMVSLIEQVMDLLAPQAHQKGLELGYAVAPEIPARLLGDPRHLRQVLINLVGNAVKFTRRGEIAVRVSMPDADGRLFRFDVVDTGIGIADDARQRIFDSFTQADPSTTRHYGGSGLGLSICKQLVTLMEGEIGVDSEPGKGSRFWFCLPLAVPPNIGKAVGLARPAWQGKRVLVIDDSEIVRHFLEQSLAALGLVCHAAADVAEAMDQLRRYAGNNTPYHMVIMDALSAAVDDLPGQLREQREFQGTRLILMNRYGAESLPMSIRADAYLTKPLRLEKVLECIVAMCGAESDLTASGEHRSRPGPGCEVLVVEDNRTNQVVVEGMLTMLGCHVEIAENGQLAVQAYKRRGWDLILMDCNMPVMDGYQATAAIRTLEEGQTTRIPIIAMTANTQPSDVEKCLAVGMDDHLSKPLTLGSLTAKLRRWKGGNSLFEPVPAPPDPVALPSSPLCPLDMAVFSKLQEALGDDVGQAIQPFLEDMPGYLEDMDDAVADGNTDQLRRAAHAVKGAAGNLGAATLALSAKEIEDSVEAGQTSEVREGVARLRAEYAQVERALTEQLKVGQAKPAEDESLDALVLVVDDDRSTRLTLRFALQRSGFDVAEAADGLEALDVVERLSPDVILMDAMMPNLDGFAACAKLKETPWGKDIPVLMITSLDDNPSIERAFAVGASDYIQKPIHLAVVNQRIKRVVEATRTERHVRHLAFYDTLTGLPNRALFTEQLTRSLERVAERLGQSLAVLFLDLDRFKFVNDTLGHETGDRLLTSVAQRIKQCVRSHDSVARLGGDEFTILLQDLPNAGAAANAAQKICRALSTPFEIDGHDIFVSTSIGISIYPTDGADVSTLLRHADTAMYRAKKANNGFQFYEESMETTVSEHLRMENALRRALERDELTVYYQPKAETLSGRITGMEALVRWRHPTRGPVSPAEFIPLAEETGLINSIGEFVLRVACNQAQAWMRSGIPNLRMAVNLSGNQLQQGGFVDLVRDVLAETGLDPRYLTLEITEGVLMEHARETVSQLHQLSDIGVNIAIDDFGTGYSSLSYLNRFPVDTLKIDQSFIRNMTESSNDAAIVTGIIALAHSLCLKVIAEGVETAEQLELLGRVNCDYIQGYYLSEPLSAPLFESRVLAQHFPDSVFASETR